MRRIVPVFGLLLAMGCSSGSSGSSTPTVSAAQACDDAISALCDTYNKCVPFFLQVGFGDVATCKTRLKLGGCEKSFALNGTSATPDKLEQCAKDIPGVTCSDVLGKKQVASCVPTPGTLVDGSACAEDAQCVSTFCSKKSDSNCGVCAKLPASGADCPGGTNEECGRELICVSKKCYKPGAKDATCDKTTQPCGAGLSCYGGKCVTAAKAGEKCDGQEKTAPNCDITAGLGCNPLNGTCQILPVSKPGEPCGLTGSDYKVCGAGGRCSGAATGTCQAPAADGAACDTAKGPDCLAPARCVSGQCKLPDPTTCK